MTKETAAPLFENWSPRMSVAPCRDGVWSGPRKVPVAALPVHPGAMGIQFGQSVFEGCKAFMDDGGRARIFRLRDHYERLAFSCERLCMPAPTERVFVKAVEDLVGDRTSWVSPFASDILYIRPVLYGEDHHVMPLPSAETMLVVLTAPLRVFPGKPLSLFAEREYIRAARGGLGNAKTAANYAHQYYPTRRAKDAGCDAVLWLDAETHSCIEEASTMNIFLLLGGSLVTPPSSDTILPGITRRSIIQLGREKYGMDVVERTILLDEVSRAAEAGTLQEMFTASTALGVRPVARIVVGERAIVLPGETPFTRRLQEDLIAIQRGREPDPWGWTKAVRITGDET